MKLGCMFISVCSLISIYRGVIRDNPYELNSKHWTNYKYTGITMDELETILIPIMMTYCFLPYCSVKMCLLYS